MRNAGTAMAGKILAIIFGYVTRIVFTHVLATELLGLNGLLQSILGSLGMNELGVTTAFVFSMYKPVAEHDEEKQLALIRQYKRIYYITGLVIGVMGALLYPYFQYLVSAQQLNVENPLLIYGIFLITSMLSYVHAYYGVVFIAYQENYINEIISSIVYIISNTMQILVLFLTRNFILYTAVYLVCTILLNVFTEGLAKKRYPYLKRKAQNQISAGEKKELNKNIMAMLMHKVGNTLINNIDNLVITSMVGFAATGIYSIYNLIIGSVRQILQNGITGAAGSVGNLGVVEDRNKVLPVFEKVLFVTCWLFGFAAILMYWVLNPFVNLSFGDGYVFDGSIVAVLCMNFYLIGVRQATIIFRDSLGLFRKDRYKTIAESLINLIVSILLAKYLGIIGVFIGTTISYLMVSIWIEPLILYRDYFHCPTGMYFRKMLLYSFGLLAGFAVTAVLMKLPVNSLFLRMLYAGIMTTLAVNGVMVLFFRKSGEYEYIRESVMKIVGKVVRR